CEKVVPGEMDNRVTAVDLALPAAFGRWVPLDHVEFPKFGLAPQRVGVTREDHRLMPALSQPTGQEATDYAGSPRDEHPYDRPFRAWSRNRRNSISMARTPHDGALALSSFEAGQPFVKDRLCSQGDLQMPLLDMAGMNLHETDDEVVGH